MFEFTKKVASVAAISLLVAGAAAAQGNNGIGASVSGEASAGANAGGVGAEASGSADAQAGGNAAAGSNAGGNAEVGASGMAGTAGDGNFGQIISAIRAGGEAGATTGVSSITVVDVESEARGENAAALENALDDRAAEIADLQASIASNAELAAALEAEGVEVDSVVALETAADGGLTVYTR